MPKEASAKYEIPAEMRNFAEKSMEQAKQAFDSFVAATQEAVNTVESRAANARTGVKDVVDLAMRFAERNMAASFEFAQRLLNAKDAKDATAIHAEYVNSQIAALTDQAKELSKKASKLAGTPH
ncbi:MAG TPA: phasin family protein [Pseudolabrys sp.]|nr:phasin family protein [Pseudolabrys sp.]